MVPIKYTGGARWETIGRAVEKVKDRLWRVTRAFNMVRPQSIVHGMLCTLVAWMLSCAAVGCRSEFRRVEEPFVVRGEMWVRGDTQMDRAQFIRLLLRSTDGVAPEEMNCDLFSTLVAGMSRKRELLSEFFAGYREWRSAPPCDEVDDYRFVHQLAEDMRRDKSEPRQAHALLICASMFNQPGWLDGVDWTTASRQAEHVFAWMQHHASFIVYDHQQACFTVDETAQALGQRVPQSRQTWSDYE